MIHISLSSVSYLQYKNKPKKKKKERNKILPLMKETF